MRSRVAALAAAITVLVALSPGAASAATEFGSNCTATSGEPGLTFVDISHSSAEPLPAAAPVSGVITQGKTTIDTSAPPAPISVTLQVYRPAGANELTLVGQAPPATVAPGANSFATRLPVQAGDHLGLTSRLGDEDFGLFCRTEDPADLMAYTEKPPPPGGTGTFEIAPGYRAPLAAVIEPDADNDGFGDETQDACPQSAALQTPCPLIEVNASSKAGRKAALIFVSATSEGMVRVKGVVKLGKGKKVTLKAGPKTVFPGRRAAFRLKFRSLLVKRLQELEPSQKLTLKVTTSATNVAGQVTTDKLKVKLKGQA